MVSRHREEKQRLDIILVKRGIFPTRSRARSEIMAGKVTVNGTRVDKPGTLVRSGAKIKLIQQENPYVSRGGLKLEAALKQFKLDLKRKVVIDIGSSTGGFTDCALKYGAQRVYAVDVGFGQLDWSLRQNPRVIVMERRNVRFLKKEDLPETPDVAVVDVSFISLKLVLPVIKDLGIAEVIALVKPQFEAGKEKVGKKGLVRSPEVHGEVLREIISTARGLGYWLGGLTFSPIKGAKGNIEYLAFFSDARPENGPESEAHLLDKVIAQAHLMLNS